MRVADYLLLRLEQEGIDTVFGLTGGGIMHLIDAITLSKSVKFQAVHHEEFAGVCADGYARSGKKFGVAFATTGPGAAHLFTAAAASWQDSVPVLLIVGQVKTSDSSRLKGIHVRQNGTFELDTIDAFSTVTKKASIVRDAEEAMKAINEAIDLCQSSRPGPVLLEIPIDVQAMHVPVLPSSDSENQSSSEKLEVINEEFFDILESAFQNSKRPLLIFGAGVTRSNSEPLIDNFTRFVQIPYTVTQFARGLGNAEHDFYLGSPGVKANRSANIGICEADLVIAVGTSLHQQVIGWNEEAFKNLHSLKIWTEIDQHVIDSRKHLVQHALNIETSIALQTLIEFFSKNPHILARFEDWRNHASGLREKYLLHFPRQNPEPDRFSLYRAISCLSKVSNRFASTVTDAGITWYVVAQHYFPSHGTRFISSGSFGAMGMALPLAIGSAHALRKPVLCITGDGSLMTCLQELATLAQSRLPILVIVNSNDGYLSIRTTHDKFFEGRKIGTDSSNGVLIPNIKDVAGLFGIDYRCVSNEIEFERVLNSKELVELDSPLVIEIRTFVNQVVEPVIVSKIDERSGQMVSGSLIDLHPPIDRAAE